MRWPAGSTRPMHAPSVDVDHPAGALHRRSSRSSTPTSPGRCVSRCSIARARPFPDSTPIAAVPVTGNHTRHARELDRRRHRSRAWRTPSSDSSSCSTARTCIAFWVSPSARGESRGYRRRRRSGLFGSDGRVISRRAFLHGTAASLFLPLVDRGPAARDALQRHHARLAVAAAARLRRRTSDPAAVSRRSAGGHADRRRPAAVRRRLPDRRHHDEPHVSPGGLPPRQSRSCRPSTSGRSTTMSRRGPRQPGNPTAMVFSDGVFFDPKDRMFKMWYMGGYGRFTCLRDVATTASRGRSRSSTSARHQHRAHAAARFEHGVARSVRDRSRRSASRWRSGTTTRWC